MAARYEVYVEDQLIDIDPRQVIAVTVQAAAIASGDISARKTSYTNQLSVPRTNRNVAIFGYSNFINVGATFPFVRKKVRINANGLQILTGVVVIKSFETRFSLQLFSLEKDLSLAIGSQVLSDLDFGDVAITWDAAFIDSVRASTTNWCAPVVNYGQIDATIADGTIGAYYLPAVAYKSIIETIISNAGYTLTGTFAGSDDYFNRMALTYSRSTWVGTTTFKLNEVLSDEIMQVDFLSDLFVKFGVFPRITGTSVELVSLETMLSTATSAIDWTSKRANKRQAVSYTWQDWAQVNAFKYPDLKYEFGTGIIQNQYDGALAVSNENIKATRTAYTSLIHAQETSATGGQGSVFWNVASVSYQTNCATMPVWETVPASFTFDNEPFGMLVLLRDSYGGEAPSIIYDGNVRTDYKIGFFQDNGVVPGLNWQTRSGSPNGLLDIYYPALQVILNAGTYAVQHDYLLNDIDMYTLDVLTPIFDTDDYFLIDKVGEYVSGRTTKVDLLKIRS